MITKEIVDGVLSIVETRKYANGKIVKRILDIQTGTPKDLIVVRESTIRRAINDMKKVNARFKAGLPLAHG